MIETLQPIDGHYFLTAYFWITFLISAVGAYIACFWE